MPNASANRLTAIDNKSTVHPTQPKKQENYDVLQESSGLCNLADSVFLLSPLKVALS